MINCYTNDGSFLKRNQSLLSAPETHIRDSQKEDANFQLIDPQDARSDGTTILSTVPIIASNAACLDWPLTKFEVLGRNVPRTDFLQLAEYMEVKTSIRQMHKPLASESTAAAA